MQAMLFLQHHLAAVVDRSSEEQMAEFHRLTDLLFRTKEQQEQDQLYDGGCCVDSGESQLHDAYRLRSSVFDSLMQYFPEHMAQPRFNLTDLVALEKAWARRVILLFFFFLQQCLCPPIRNPACTFVFLGPPSLLCSFVEHLV